MREHWRFTFTYSTSDLNERLNEIRSGEFHGDYCFLREILLQAFENGLIRLPEFPLNDAHRIPINQITFLDPPSPNHPHH